LPATRQLGAIALLALALILTLVLGVLASTFNPGIGHIECSFLTTLVVFACLLSIMLVFAARGAAERFSLAGSGAAWLLAVAIFSLFVVYMLGTGTASVLRLLTMAGFLFVPLLLISLAQDGKPGCWQDFLTLAIIWVAVKFGPSHWVWPYPETRLAYVFTVIVAVDLAIAGFLILRRTQNVGYGIGWGSSWFLYVFSSLALFASVAIPLGLRIHFITYAPRVREWRMFLPLAVGILFFTAWPEELLFRGLLQNLLSRASNNEAAGWVAASVLFGFSHITNMHFPNWRYVLLASIAGLCYGWTWRKTGSIFASAIVHGSVDVLWHFLFRTV
jgi:membrane protease YdiL (CAAX protease family)